MKLTESGPSAKIFVSLENVLFIYDLFIVLKSRLSILISVCFFVLFL